jgi:poly(A) polymerase
MSLDLAGLLERARPLRSVRESLGSRPAWLVGGSVRDVLMDRSLEDIDLVVPGDAETGARDLAQAVRGHVFPLSERFGAWRVIAPDRSWQADLTPVRGDSIEADLALRDFTVNAMAVPLAGGELLDPHGGRADLEARRVRMVAPTAFADDPLRTLRAVRLVVELDLRIDPATASAVAAHARWIDSVAPERVFGELKRIVTARAARTGVELMDAHGLTEAVLPELAALRGIEQNEFHHADVHEHTLEVLDAVARLERDRDLLGDRAPDLLGEPLADELTHGGAMRFAALLHDAAKPQTRGERPDGRVTFIGHDRAGADLARAVLRRLRAAQRTIDYVAALTLHHLRLGFLVHEQPLDRRAVWRYLRATAPWSDDVTIFTVADRLATRGRNAEEAIAAHVELAREMLTVEPPPAEPLVRGDDLARELGIARGPKLGELLAQLEEDRFAGAVATRDDAIARARELLGPC